MILVIVVLGSDTICIIKLWLQQMILVIVVLGSDTICIIKLWLQQMILYHLLQPQLYDTNGIWTQYNNNQYHLLQPQLYDTNGIWTQYNNNQYHLLLTPKGDNITSVNYAVFYVSLMLLSMSWLYCIQILLIL
jgi:hypothetical protein